MNACVIAAVCGWWVERGWGGGGSAAASTLSDRVHVWEPAEWQRKRSPRTLGVRLYGCNQGPRMEIEIKGPFRRTREKHTHRGAAVQEAVRRSEP